MSRFFPVPIIRPNQYDSFRRAVGTDLADTYDEWLKLIKERDKEALIRGEDLVRVEVDYDQFMAFCSATGTKPNGKLLLDFVVSKDPRGKK